MVEKIAEASARMGGEAVGVRQRPAAGSGLRAGGEFFAIRREFGTLRRNARHGDSAMSAARKLRTPGGQRSLPPSPDPGR